MHSMTGFGSATATGEFGRISVEVRGVNHRFLDVHVRLPRDMAAAEPKIREAVEKHAKRGRVEVSVWLTPPNDLLAGSLDPERLRPLREALSALAASLGLADEVKLETLLALRELAAPGGGPLGAERSWEILAEPVDKALADFATMREREGEALVADARVLLDGIERCAAVLAERAPSIAEEQGRALAARISELARGVEIAPERLAQEVALIADRSDVREELTRLKSHLAQARQLLRGRHVGRKLDFLVQELFREANTTGSKLSNAATTQEIVQMKSHIEQLREQVQNLE